MGSHTDEPHGSDESTHVYSSSEPIYYLHEEDVCWWDEQEAPAPVEPVEEWIHPPAHPNLQQAVHKLNATHIVSPFLHRQYPHQFKSDAYLEYNKREASDDKGAEHDAEKPADEKRAAAEREQQRVNIELTPAEPDEIANKPKKSLRERLRSGEVVFYEDYIEREIARDHCRLFGEPFNVPRHDWGGGDFFFGEYVMNNVPKVDEEPKETEVEEEEEDVKEVVEAPVKHHEVDELILADETLDPKKRQELLDGEITSIFSTMSSSNVRQKHPKDRLVRFHHLRNYACMIDSVTKCPLIHVELQSALKHGWDHEEEATKIQEKERSTARAKDPYQVSPEQVAKANEILASRRQPKEESSKLSQLLSRRRCLNKETVQVGGGRYQV